MVSHDKDSGLMSQANLDNHAFGQSSVSSQFLRQQSFLHMQDGVSIVNASGSHVEVNPAFCTMTGFTRDELIGSLPEERYWPPEEKERIRAAFENTLNGDFDEFELIFMRRDGERFPVLVDPFRVKDGDGTVFYAATVKDITQRVKMEESLRNSETLYRALFESAGEAILLIDGDRIVDCNRRTSEIFGYSREKILSEITTDFFPATQPDGRSSRDFYAEMVEAAHSGEPQVFEWTGRSDEGSIVHAEITLTSITLGRKAYLHSIVRDITLRKSMEKELIDLNRFLEERVAIRTEELEKAYAELLQQNVHYQELARRLTLTKEQERKRIARLLHDNHQQLLAAAKIRIETLLNAVDDTPLRDTAHHVIDILDKALEITGSLTIELDPPHLLGPELVVATRQLALRLGKEFQLDVIVQGALPPQTIPTQVCNAVLRSVQELLFNVVKHSGVGAARITILSVEHHLELTVEDSGSGFNVKEALAPSNSYGLFSIQQQLNYLNGALSISSSPQRGTRCTLSIPIPAADALYSEVSSSSSVQRARPSEMMESHKTPVRIMVVDDHEHVRNAIIQVLALADEFEVVGSAVDGLDAIDKARNLKPEIILMDVSMPRVSGIEATHTITTENNNISVIGLSMQSSDEIRSRMIAAGARDCLKKLTSVDELLSAIRSVAGRTGPPG